jgi:hypothetical protein
MIRTLVIATMMVAAGPALAEMAAPAKPPKPPKEVTVRGCTGAGFAGCSTLQAGKESLMLIGKAGVALPAPKTYIVATGVVGPAGPNVCRATKKMVASKIIQTRRACK